MSWQAFNAKVAESLELREKLKSITSPVELFGLAKEQGLELTGEDLQAIAQNAYQQWLSSLEGQVRAFFAKVHTDPELNQQLKQCQTTADAIALAKACAIELTTADLSQAAIAAEAVAGFSFEKLWFKKLGLIP
jgi:predicted ribosomally synthesized peptide with nif11-like leader